MSNRDEPTLPPPQMLETLPTAREIREQEKSALREAIYEVATAAVGERGSRLLALLDKIEKNNGAKATFDSIIKLLEFAQPKLQRVTLEDPNGNPPAMPQFVVQFGSPAKLVNPPGYTTIEVPSDEQPPA